MNTESWSWPSLQAAGLQTIRLNRMKIDEGVGPRRRVWAESMMSTGSWSWPSLQAAGLQTIRLNRMWIEGYGVGTGRRDWTESRGSVVQK